MRFAYFTAAGLCCVMLPTMGAPTGVQNAAQKTVDSRQTQQQNALNAEIQSQQVQPPNVRLESEQIHSPAFPQNESPCFSIHQLLLTDYSPRAPQAESLVPSQFSWAKSAVFSEGDFALPACIGAKGINVLLRRLQNRLIEQGYVTTRVVAEPQDLRTGVLRLTVIPGRVGHIQLQDQSATPFATKGTLWFAMPMTQGDILNVRDIEQGLENLKRVPSAEANIELQPGTEMGETDIVVAYKQGVPVHLTLGVEDSGSKATGRLQGSATLSWDNPLHLNDLFYLSATRSVKRHSDAAQGDYGSRNLSWYYSVPWKRYLLTLSGSRYTYHQTVAGAFESYNYAGESQQMKLNLSRLLSRGARHKTYANIALWTKKSHNAINDTEIEVQRRRTAGWEAGISHTHYVGAATFSLNANYKRGTGANKALRAPEENFNEGTSRMRILTASLNMAYPFHLGNQPWRFTSHWQAQWNKSPLVQQDKFSIGGRYTVRGFDGELTLAGERGWFWRNELAWNVMNKGHEIYLGVDRGIVRSSRTELQVGNSLTGGVLGVRGNLWGLNYDYFVGTPIKKPQGFRTSHVTTGFSVSYRF